MSTSSTPRLPGRSDGVTDFGRLMLGLTVVTLGVILLLGAADVLDSSRLLHQWWPLVVVVAGLLTLLERPPAIMRGLLLTVAGGVLLLFTTDTLDETAWAYVWPAAIVAAGLVILLRWRGRVLPGAGESGDEIVRATAIFGGPHIVSTSPRFRGGWLTAVFGGITLDLRQARLEPGGATINATTAFGGIEILVPRGWRIAMHSTPVFGGTEDKTDHSATPPEDAPTLRVDAVTVFGGLEIKHEK